MSLGNLLLYLENGLRQRHFSVRRCRVRTGTRLLPNSYLFTIIIHIPTHILKWLGWLALLTREHCLLQLKPRIVLIGEGNICLLVEPSYPYSDIQSREVAVRQYEVWQPKYCMVRKCGTATSFCAKRCRVQTRPSLYYGSLETVVVQTISRNFTCPSLSFTSQLYFVSGYVD